MELYHKRADAWVIGPDGDDQCSESADTVVLQSDDDEHIACAGTLHDIAQNAAMKKAAATCETCESRPVSNATCISGNTKLCEMCDLAEWAAGLCSSCGDMPATRDQSLRSAQLCDVCDLSLWVLQNGFI